MTAIIVTALGVMVAVPCMLPFLLERLLGTFWMAVMVSGCWAVLSLMFGLIHATLIQVIYLIFAAFWAWIAWRNRHKRRKLPTARKLGYKARELLRKLVAGMPKARPVTMPLGGL